MRYGFFYPSFFFWMGICSNGSKHLICGCVVEIHDDQMRTQEQEIVTMCVVRNTHHCRIISLVDVNHDGETSNWMIDVSLFQ